MKKTLTTLAVALAVLGSPLMASADGVTNQQGSVTVTVEAGCSLTPMSDINIAVDTGSQASFSGGFSLLCNDQLPYIVEIDNAAGGIKILSDPVTGNQDAVVWFQQEDGSPWGANTNGEAITGTGTGTWEYKPFSVWYNLQGDAGLIPVAQYEAVSNVTLTFF